MCPRRCAVDCVRCGDGGGSSGGGRGISWDHPLLDNISFLAFLNKGNGHTDGRTDGQTHPLIEMRGRI